MIVTIGQPVPLKSQISDQNDALTVVASLYDELNEFIQDVRLNHVSKGLYYSTEFKMPPVSFIIAQFIVLNDKDEIYESTSEIIYSKEPEVVDDFLKGRFAEIIPDGFMEGSLSES